MLDLVNGLPVHPLVVHGVAVLLPLATLGILAIAVRPAWRARYGSLVAAVAVIGTLMVPLATSSGEELEHRVGNPGEHAELGETLIWFALPMTLLAIAMVVLDRRARATGTPDGWKHQSRALSAVAALAVVAALGTTAMTVVIGDTGARAAWGDQISSSQSGEHTYSDDD